MLFINLSHKPRLWSSPAPCLAKSPCSVLCYLQWHSDVFALEPGGSVAGAVRCVPWQALSFSHYWRPCFHTSYPLQSLWLSSHPCSLSLYRISHGWVTRRWPTGVCFAFLQTTFVPSHQHFFPCLLHSFGWLFFQEKKKKICLDLHRRRGGSTLGEQINLLDLRGSGQPGWCHRRP